MTLYQRNQTTENHQTKNNKLIADSSDMRAQAWLVIIALFCFVMHSIRRIV